MAPIAQVCNLAVAFPSGGNGWRRVVDGVFLTVEEGEVMGLVGESGCGKTLTALALFRLIPEPGRIAAGTVSVGGQDVLALDERRLSSLRGGLAGLVFQEPAQALNPVRSIGFQVSEAARLHLELPGQRAEELVPELLAEVGLEDPAGLARAYPHQLSGGQRQRVLLACALSANPRLLVADEPTSALDTVSQQHMVELLERLRERRHLAVLFISHDLALVGRLADRVTVLYAGETVEVAPREALFDDPRHPYTRALMRAQLRVEAEGPTRLPTVPGAVPRAGEWGRGCRFAPRCPVAFKRCRMARPALSELENGRQVRCFLFGDAEESDGRV
jgi:oligopeptide/dipeptide ABC transporter ATP-binding protein